jgi:hypothetical protein
MAIELQPAAVDALNQAPIRIVVLSRTAETGVAASHHHKLQGAAVVELHPIDPPIVVTFLRSIQSYPPPDGWDELIGRLEHDPGSGLARALGNPLALTLIRDTYQEDDDVLDLLDLCPPYSQRGPNDSAMGVTDVLLDRVVRAAYTHRAGQLQPRYDIDTARHTLEMIAKQLSQARTRDLQWWNLGDWAPIRPRRVRNALGTGALFGFPTGASFGPVPAVVVGLVAGTFGFASGGSPEMVPTPRAIGKLRVRRVPEMFEWRAALIYGSLGGMLCGFVASVHSGVLGGLVGGLLSAFVFALVTGLVFGLISGLNTPDSTVSRTPLSSRRADRSFALVSVLISGLGSALLVTILVFAVAWKWPLEMRLIFGASFGLLVGLVVGLSISKGFWASVSSAQLAIRWDSPVRLMRFLDDAHNRNVLRTVGPIYQFRHVRLQDRLAEQGNRDGDLASRPAEPGFVDETAQGDGDAPKAQ